MYWSEEEVEDYIRYPSEGSAEELGSPIYFIGQNELEQDGLMEDLTNDLEEKGYDYAPIRPYNSGEYYELETGEVHSTDEGQYVGYNEIMLYCINILTEYPFALATHPDRDSWQIVTPADLNTRTAKEFLFTYYAEMAKAVSDLIKENYTIDELQEIYEDARPGGGAIGRWSDAVDENVNLHPVEFMSIADLKEVVRDNEDLLDELDFRSKTQCKQAFDTVEKYRNKVMHGNRSVISSEEDVGALVESIEISCDIAINVGGDGPGLDIPP
ncbi:hypothetical protein RH831_10970 [Halodesulfurarchaeum sp. HSR-GB]|uniref:hypothetical protein n=1 Tax=Halodesulfurarchaeum sp. HSR-GB TaxID=3074077 RepID=UPI002859C929|nr:hypothetical protein [Halodesulfurarchaeum sp. HSR-GB]MDR5657697.1 hypothetical protein [Halodesulfurarchaeum sp. HSR-GB]